MTRRAAALKHFKRVDPHFYTATLEHHTSLPTQLVAKRTSAELFERLIKTVISQQLGTAAARSIFARVKKACGGRIMSKVVLRPPPAPPRAAGLSGSKIKTLKSIATAVETGELNLLALKKVPETD